MLNLTLVKPENSPCVIHSASVKNLRLHTVK